MTKETQIRVEGRAYSPLLEVYMTNGRGSWGQGIMMEEVQEGCTPPSLTNLSQSNAQQLMDDLYRAGFRPTEGAGSAGSLAATQHHLADMRKLVFDK